MDDKNYNKCIRLLKEQEKEMKKAMKNMDACLKSMGLERKEK